MSLQNIGASMERLVTIMDELREKCPWDKKQTIHTLRQQTIEETFELVDAITDSDWPSLKEELGDLLLHIVFYAKIGKEQDKFSLEEVIQGICEKLIRRHPHIYGNVTVNSDEDVKKNWEQIKLAEGKTSVLSGVPKSLPATVKAMRLQEKAKQVGFEWDKAEDVFLKIQEELDELKEAVASQDKKHMEEELGDVFFSVINYSRFLGVDAENALELTNKKFYSRFTRMETAARNLGKKLEEMTLAQMDELWNQIKRDQIKE
jgi:MazG family protein